MEEVPSILPTNVGGRGTVVGEATVSVSNMGGRGNGLDKAPVSVSLNVGDRGRDLDAVSGGTSHGLGAGQLTGSSGRPVRGGNGIVGYMHDFEAADRKVGDITFVFSCYVIHFVAGICITSFGFVITLASIAIHYRNSV